MPKQFILTRVLTREEFISGIILGVLRNAMILAHDHCRGKNGRGALFDMYIGRNCVIGVNSIILPGVSVGDCCVVAAEKMPHPNTIVAGNPAKVIRTGIRVENGQIVEKGERINV